MANQAMDLELKTMQQIWRLLGALSHDSRIRVLDWVNDRNDAELEQSTLTDATSSGCEE